MDRLLTREVLAAGGKSANDRRDARVCQLAAEHADYMAQVNGISHDGFEDSRYPSLRAQGATNAAEIVAYNSGRGSSQAAAATCAKSWKNSPNHWNSMRQSWSTACYVMIQSGAKFYCIGLFANGF